MPAPQFLPGGGRSVPVADVLLVDGVGLDPGRPVALFQGREVPLLRRTTGGGSQKSHDGETQKAQNTHHYNENCDQRGRSGG